MKERKKQYHKYVRFRCCDYQIGFLLIFFRFSLFGGSTLSFVTTMDSIQLFCAWRFNTGKTEQYT